MLRTSRNFTFSKTRVIELQVNAMKEDRSFWLRQKEVETEKYCKEISTLEEQLKDLTKVLLKNTSGRIL